MIATVINTIAIVAGSLLGLVFKNRIDKKFEEVVFNAVGMISFVLGIMMALRTTRILYLALTLVVGGLLGTWWNVEGLIHRFGEFLKSHFAKKEDTGRFAIAFMDASVLFCVGAMALIGSFKAGAEGDYTMILTKSVMDGFLAVLLTTAMGVGVAFSAISVLAYQGTLTLLSIAIKSQVSPLILSELTGCGGVLVMMIGLNLLGLKQIKTANFLPALIVGLAFVLIDPFIRFLPIG
jgi:uncharacterized membrane protein YqgA involved in biofilm formation